jgi:hypothetical protein
MDQPVRLGLVFPRSGQRLFVMASVESSTHTEQKPSARKITDSHVAALPKRRAIKTE